MRGFKKILTLKTWNMYDNAKFIADDIIKSMTENYEPGSYSEQPEYISTVKCSLGSCIRNILYVRGCRSLQKCYDMWVVKIYCRKYKSIPSIDTQSCGCRDFDVNVLNTVAIPNNSFDKMFCDILIVKKVLINNIDMYKNGESSMNHDARVSIMITIRGCANEIIGLIETMDKLYPSQMKRREVDVNDVLHQVTEALLILEEYYDATGLKGAC